MPDDPTQGEHVLRRTLTAPEEQFWILAQKNPVHRFHHCPLGIDVAGSLRRAELRQAFVALIERHPMLRARFVEQTGSIHCLIEPPGLVEPPVRFVDLGENDDEALRSLIAEDIARPFDLAVAPLWRSVVFSLGSGRTYVHLCLHHIISDATGFDVVVRDLADLYTANVEGRVGPPVLGDALASAEPPAAPAAADEAESYWLRMLDGMPQGLSLPIDFARPERSEHPGGVVVRHLEGAAYARFRAAAAALEATPQMMMLAAYATCLARIANQPDVVIGAVVSQRRTLLARSSVGCYANTVPLRISIPAAATGRDVVHRARESTIGAIARQALPFQQLVSRLARHGLRAADFSVLFVHHAGFPDPDRWFADLSAKLVFEEAEQAASEFELFLQTFERNEGLRITLQYRRDLFEACTANRILDSLLRIVDAIVTDCDAALADVDVITADDRADLLVDWQGEVRELPADETVVDMIARQARRSPDAVAVADSTGTLTYGELGRASLKLARRLIALGVKRECCIALLMPRTTDLVVAIIGIMRAGCAYVPLDFQAPLERLRFMIDDTEAAVVITESTMADVAASLGVSSLLLDVARAETADAHGISNGTASAERRPAANDLAYVIYTSGSTGDPKGVAIEHRSLANLASWAQRYFSAEELSGVLCASSVTFDSSVFEIFAPLCAGGTVVLASDLLAAPALPAMWRVRLFVTGAPTVLKEVIRAHGLPVNVKGVLLAGEPVTAALVDQIYSAGRVENVYNLYGPTEATVYVTAHRVERSTGRDAPIGRPIANAKAHVLDASMRLAPIGTVGELYLGGIPLARGYHRRPELNAKAFVPSPFAAGERLYRTGDLARRAADGLLAYAGRIDRQIKIRGYRIEAGEIEARLERHPAVAQCVVVARAAADAALVLVAYVQPAGARFSAAELRAFLSHSLPRYMIPSLFVAVASLPNNANGKLDVSALPEPASLARKEVEPFESEVERGVARIWTELLGMSVSPADAFFDVGGTSLHLLRLAQALEDAFGVAPTTAELFSNPTVRDQARWIASCASRETAPATGPSAAVPMPREDDLAIVGAACRLPGATTPEEFWRLQVEARDCITAVPPSRWSAFAGGASAGVEPACRFGGFLFDIDGFDAAHFRISDREARLMDPQQRLLLEVTHEAFERAGLRIDELRGQHVGVFVGASAPDHMLALARTGEAAAPYATSGSALSMLANRISYVFGLTGPSISVDTACSSSLVALHLARQSVLARECEIAVVAGVSLLLAPTTVAGWEASGVVSADGRCRPFDEAANGYGPAEGTVVIVIRRHRDAITARHDVIALLKGTAVNHDGGAKMGLTVPNAHMQADVVRRALEAAGTTADAITYVEAHGSGTKLGDPLEFSGLVEAFRSQSDRVGFCRIGCVKSNVGHLGPAAGLVGVLKVALALQRGELPEVLHLRTPNPSLGLEGSPFRLCRERQPWRGNGVDPRRAGISGFGFGGTNAHAVLEEPLQVLDDASAAPAEMHLLTLSARSHGSLTELASAHGKALSDLRGDVGDFCATANRTRVPHSHRLAVLGRTAAELADVLNAFARTGSCAGAMNAYAGVAGQGNGKASEEDAPAAVLLRHEVLHRAACAFSGGADVDWAQLDGGARWRRVTVPATPFERRPGPSRTNGSAMIPSRTATGVGTPLLWCFEWQQSVLRAPNPQRRPQRVLLSANDAFADALAASLALDGRAPFRCDSFDRGAIHSAVAELRGRPLDLIYLVPDSLSTSADAVADLGQFYDGAIAPLVHVANSLRVGGAASPVLRIVTRRAQNVLEGDIADPMPAILWGYAATAAREFPAAAVQCCDIDDIADEGTRMLLAQELSASPTDAAVAFRNGRRFAGNVEPLSGNGALRALHLRECGRYLITGGGGGIGNLLATMLAERYSASTMLVSRNAGTPPHVLARCLDADVTDPATFGAALEETLTVLGGLDGVFHLAGSAPRRLIADETRANALDALGAKVAGLQVVARAIEDLDLDFLAAFSSLASIAGNVFRGSYSGAARFADAFAVWRTARGHRTVSIGWAGWHGVGMGADAKRHACDDEPVLDSAAALAAVDAALGCGRAHIFVSPTRPEQARIPAAADDGRVEAEPDRIKIAAATDTLLAVLEEFLELEPGRASITTPFLDLGLDSIAAVAMVERLEALCGRTYRPTLFFDHANVAALARFLASDLPAAAPHAPAAASSSRVGAAIVGIALRLPHALDVDELWVNVISGRDCTQTIPADRWGDTIVAHDLPRCRGGFLADPFGFDATPFGISPREARNMDPQQRALLEVVHEALEECGWPSDAEREKTGVFVGASAPVFADDPRGPIESDSLLGASTAILANRVSYVFDLRGPSVVVDTLCSSSLVALHQAVESLERGECDLAVVAGVRIGVSPRYFEGAVRSGAISKSGICRTFDARADGMIPGEGVVVVVLRRLADALAAADRIRAVVRGSAVGHTGRGSGLTVPRAQAQADVIAAALTRAGVEPSTIGYVEAHGTGTSLGDPIELEGLRLAFGARSPSQVCAVGSLKPNIGHLEAASGLAGVVKCALVLERAVFPPTANYEAPNPELALANGPFFIAERAMSWTPSRGVQRRAGVSAFGIGGVNAHVVLEEAPPVTPRATPSAKSSYALPLSAHTPEALRVLASRFAATMTETRDDLADLCRTAGTARPHARHRIAAVGRTSFELSAQLLRFATGDPTPGAVSGRTGARPPRVAFVFAGQGVPANGVDRALYEGERVFRDALDRCAARLARHLPVSIVDVLFRSDDAQLRRADLVQPALFSVQYALAELLLSWGIRPDCVVGHSLGEYVAACVAGAVELDAVLDLVAARGRLMHAACPDGAMAAIQADEGCVADLVKASGGAVVVAAENAPGSFVLSGSRIAVEAALATLKPRARHVERLALDVGYHSPQIDPVLEELEGLAAATVWRRPALCWVSTLTGGAIETAVGAEHWRRHARDPVRYARALETAADLGSELFVDLGPTSAMAAIGSRALRERGVWLYGLTGSRDALRELHRTAARAYVAGVGVDWAGVDGGPRRPRVAVPKYPFERPAPTTHDAPPPAPPNGAYGVELLEAVRAIVGDLLDLPPASVDSDIPLVELGANSLTVAGLSERLAATFGTPISAREALASHPTVAALARHIAANSRPAPPVPAPVAREEADSVVAVSPGVANFIGAYVSRTHGSRSFAQRARTVLADSRGAAGFRPSLKELVYPIVADRAHSARIWDVDGNEYVDIAMGFGVQLFGHSSPELIAAAQRALDEGLYLGPQSKRAEDVARRLCSMTGTERCTFVNSGSEAMMVALRLARAATRRRKIAIFAGSYHGFYDGTLVTGGTDSTAGPIGSGLPHGAVGDVLVLPYGEESSLRTLRACAAELAAVVVEPVQSRRPGFQPVDFLSELRDLTRRAGVVLVFDEVVTGFRVHPGGAQALFGVRADLATYGKILGGGHPVGAVAGSAALLDLVDGGFWRYGDDSAPDPERVFVASTFAKNPMALAMADAVLARLERSGLALQDDLGRRTDDLRDELNARFVQRCSAIAVTGFRSLFRFDVPPALELFHYSLIAHGVYVWEGRTCFLSTAHTDEDVAAVVRGVEAALDDLNALGLEAPSGTAPAGTWTVPPSPLQRDVWMLAASSEVASSAFNEAVLVDVQTPLDADALRRALRKLSDRHEMLRAAFDPEGGRMRIGSAVSVPLTVEALPPALEALGDVIAVAAARPFDLEWAPLLRVHLWPVGDRRTLLLLVAHHLVIDADGFDTLLAELGALYRGEANGSAVVLGAPESYRELARDWAIQPNDHDAAFWKAKFAQGLPALDLPIDYVWDEPIGMIGTRVRFDLKLSVDAVARRAGAAGVTPFMLLLAAFQAWLFRITGNEEIVVGIPHTLRPGRCKALIGQCVTLLPIAARVDASATLSALAASARDALLEGMEHGSYAVSVLAALTGAVGRIAPFRVAFNMDPGEEPSSFAGGPARFIGLNAPVSPLDLRALGGGVVEIASGTVKQALELSVRSVGGAYRACLEASTDLFRRETVTALAESFATFAGGFVASEDLMVADVPLVGEAERRRLLVDLNDTRTALPIPAHFADAFDTVCVQFSGAIAVADACGELSYRDLRARALDLAGKLGMSGTGAGDIVALYGPRSVDYLVTCVAVLVAGAAFMPLDRRDPPQRLAAVLRRSGARTVVSIGTDDRNIRDAVRMLPEGDVEIFSADRGPIGSPSGTPSGLRDGAALAYVIFTSGSTGEPKGVMIEHRSMMNHLYAKVSDLGLDSADVIAQTAPTAFDVFIWQFLVSFLTGGKTVVVDDDDVVDPLALIDEVTRFGATVLEIVPSLLREVLQELESRAGERREFTRLRWLLVGGEPLTAKLCERWRHLFPRTPVVNVYGPAECAIDVTHHKVLGPADESRRAMPIGQPLCNIELYVLDATCHPVPLGVTGELFIGGACVGAGYVNDPERSAAAFMTDVPHGLQAPDDAVGARVYRTGDLVRRAGDGLLEFLGRADGMIKLAGQRIELGEIEAALERHPSVRTCCAHVVVRDGRDLLCGYVVPTNRDAVDDDDARRALVDELRQHLDRLLPRHMVPRELVLVGALPRTRSGKLDRSALAALVGAPQNLHSPAEPNAVESAVRSAMARNLGKTDVEVDVSYFDLGGDSLSSISLLREIQNRLGRRIPFSQFLTDPTVGGLARLVGGARPPSTVRSTAPILLDGGGRGKPLYFVHPAGGDVAVYVPLARKLGGSRAIYAFAPDSTDAGAASASPSIETLGQGYLAGLTPQSETPCVLAGWSMGGVVAFEIARRLAASGRNVPLLVLIDSEFPQPPGVRRRQDEHEILRLFCGALGFEGEPNLPAALERLDTAARIRAIRERLSVGRGRAAVPSAEALQARYALFASNVEAMWSYRARAYDGRVLVVAASQTAVQGDPSLGWRAVAVDLVCETVAGDHFSIMAEPALSMVADIVGAHMP